jgi:hypothetical protein
MQMFSSAVHRKKFVREVDASLHKKVAVTASNLVKRAITSPLDARRKNPRLCGGSAGLTFEAIQLSTEVDAEYSGLSHH